MRPIKVTLNKLEVTERQIDTAIWLWFNDGDVVSIVQLTDAALGVLDDLYQDAKKGRPYPFDPKMAPAEMTPRDARNQITADASFARHARTDPDKTHNYRFDKTTAYLYCACAAYFNLTGDHGKSGLRSLFVLRYGMMHPTLFKTPRSAIQTPKERDEVERLKSLSRTEFFKERGKDLIGTPPSPDWWPDDRHLGIPL